MRRLILLLGLPACAAAEPRLPLSEWTITAGQPLLNWLPLCGNPGVLPRSYFIARAVDVDADGDFDLLRAGNRPFAGINRNDGSGSFGPHEPCEDLVGLQDVVAGDFNADGYLDLACQAGGNEWEAYVLWNDGAGRFLQKEYVITSPRQAEAIASADFDGSPGSELILMESHLESDGVCLSVLQWRKLGWTQIASGTECGSLGPGLTWGDVDGNARTDVMLLRARDAYLQHSDGSITLAALQASPWSTLGAADLDGDGQVEVLGQSANWLRALKFRGGLRWDSLPLIELVGRPQLVFADLNADQRLDIVLLEHPHRKHDHEEAHPSRYSAFVSQPHGFELRSMPFAPGPEFPLPDLVADFNGDGQPDLLFLAEHPGSWRMRTNPFDTNIPGEFSFSSVGW